MKTFSATVALLLVLAGCGSGDTADDQAVTAPIETTTTTTTTLVEDQTEPPGSLPLADAVEAADPSVVELDDDITVATTVHALTMDAGTEWALPLHIAAPAGWTWDAGISGFTNGASTLRLETGCSAGCQTTAWDVVLTQDGQLLSDPFADLAEGGSEGFSSSTALGAGSLGRQRRFDDGSGRSVTALYHHGGGRWLGCTADTPATPEVELDVLTDLCEAVVADWSTVLANTTTSTIEETISDDIASILDEPTIGQPLQVVALDEDGEHNVSMQVPADATIDVDGLFGTEVRIGEDFSIFTELELNASCDGICEAQNWGAKINGPAGELGRLRASITPENDAPIEDGWILSGPEIDGDGVLGAVMRWDDTASHYFSCTIEVDARDVDRADELLTICLTAEPLWFG